MAVTTKICSYCNKRIGAGAEVCPSCGGRQVKPLGESLEELGSWWMKLMFWLIVLVILGSCLLVLKF